VIVSASYRTDIPAFYARWFLRRPNAGRCVAANPYGGNRPGCRCAGSRDVGASDTCPYGCVYCDAVADRDRAVANFRGHDPDTARLLGRRLRASR
jgi:hypothetical protein